jgi:hypothetical protein
MDSGLFGSLGFKIGKVLQDGGEPIVQLIAHKKSALISFGNLVTTYLDRNFRARKWQRACSYAVHTDRPLDTCLKEMEMKKIFLLAVFLGLVLNTAVAANADDHAAVNARKNMLIYSGSGGDQIVKSVSVWKKILSTTIDAEGSDDQALLISVSAVTGIFTSNTNIENPNDLRVVTDSAAIQVAVKVDGKWATPGLVTFDSLMRFNIDTNSASFASEDLSAQTTAHSFNFYKVGLADTDGDDHKVEVFARISVDANALTNSGVNLTDMSAFIGPRTLTVETAQVDDDE